MTRFVLDIDDSQWKADHLPRVLRTTESEWLNELACQVEIQIADARPLIVLDLEYPQIAINALEMAFRDHTNGDARTIYRSIADQIEAQTKPARIPEPSTGSRVTATMGTGYGRFEYLRVRTASMRSWANLGSGHLYTWDALIDPTLIREGVTS